MTLLEYINSEDRGFFLPDMATNGLFLTNYKAYDIYENPNNQLEMAKVMDETFESDFIYSFCDGIIFCETLGLDILKSDYDFPSVLNHPITDIEILSKCEVPDPYKTGRMPVNIESLTLIANNIKKPLYVSIQGPFTLAIQLAGATHLLRSIITDPEFVEKLLEFTTETVRRYSVAVNKAGAKLISISEPAAVTLNPERFDKYVVPNVEKIYKELTCWKSMHICGDTSYILDNMLSCSIDAISLDQIMNYEDVKHRIPDDIVLIGNLDPIELLGRGKPEDIRKETIKLMKIMRENNNYLCAFGCNCLNDTPVENLQSAIKTGRMAYKELDSIHL
ncbi:uroporphyrinogen decarboxylase family protein [Tepidibacter hydrothermalis]|uniref:Uroporphyrinogen decarboxylase family protein n=1 Tax=Tepidibacter hydrothermalis TaxID=3036126 RepID=A0ABY8EEC8_9FIRM|nr:uroporphyrinogen decarboxylase family protein [Tepidibacter hydrothermalis]WFD11303.1 uroporphyrinogen decarboxylase family protein [Tepidibacter hydrothermalis]